MPFFWGMSNYNLFWGSLCTKTKCFFMVLPINESQNRIPIGVEQIALKSKNKQYYGHYKAFLNDFKSSDIFQKYYDRQYGFVKVISQINT